MNHNKSLLLVVAEWWESRKARQLSIGGKSIGFWRGFLPTPGNVIFTLLVIGSLLWAQSVGAVSLAAPTVNSSLTIPYQGRLANASGTPFTGNQNMEFRLYNVPSGGTPLWSELWTGGNSVTVNDGLFSVLLGSLTAGLPAVVQGNGQLWLGITVGTDGEMSPRVQLGSAAYSMQALTVPDGSVTSAKIADGAVTNRKQTATTYYLNDSVYKQAISNETGKKISEFMINQVPAGDIAIYCSFIAVSDIATGFGGTISLATESNPTDLAQIPTHVMGNYWDNYVLHGRLADFAGGDLKLSIIFHGEGGNSTLHFGAAADNYDSRFGRKCTVIAGI